MIFSDPAREYDRLWRETTQVYEKWAQKRGVSCYELFALLSIAEMAGCCTQKIICDQWAFPKQTVHGILKNFQKKGWVCLLTQAQDKRNKRIVFTPEGEKAAKTLIESLEQQEKIVWEKMGIEKTQSLLENTSLYNRYFQEAEENETL